MASRIRIFFCAPLHPLFLKYTGRIYICVYVLCAVCMHAHTFVSLSAPNKCPFDCPWRLSLLHQQSPSIQMLGPTLLCDFSRAVQRAVSIDGRSQCRPQSLLINPYRIMGAPEEVPLIWRTPSRIPEFISLDPSPLNPLTLDPRP